MATQQELQDQLDEIRQKRADLSNKVVGLNIQHSTSNAHILGPDFAAMDKVRFNSALKPLLMQDRILHQQEQQLLQAQGRTEREQRQAITAKNQADRAAAQAQKAEVAARKQAKDEINTQVTDALGLPKNKGVDYINNNGYYDPATGRIAVPDKPIRTPISKDDKGDAKAIKEVHDKLADYGSAQGVKGTFNPSSFFDKNAYPVSQNESGDYVYKTPGGELTIPADEVEGENGLQARYNEHFDVPNATSGVSNGTNQGVKYIPVSTFQQANQALNQINGKAVIDPATRYIQSQTMNRQAAPALAAAAAPTPGATAVPSVISAPDISTTIDSPTLGASLLRGHDPAWDMYAAKRAEEAAAKKAALIGLDRQVQDSGGLTGSVRELAGMNQQAIDAGAKTPEERNAFIRGRVAQQQQKEALLPVGPGVPFIEGIQNAAGNDIATLAPVVSSGFDYLSRASSVLDPRKIVGNYAKKGLEAVGETTLPLIMSGARALSGPNLDDISKKYFAAKGSNEIGADVTLEDFAQRYNPTNATSTPELLVP